MARSKIKILGLENIHVDNIRFDGTSAALGWQYQGARFHIWVLLPDLTPGGNIVTYSKPITIFKNPLAERGEPGHFDTRRIDGTKKIGSLMIAEATAYALKNNLVAAALAAKDAEDKAADAEMQENIKLHRKEQAAGAMYDVLRALEDHCQVKTPETVGNPVAHAAEGQQIRLQIQAALKLAEEGPQS